VEYEAPLEWREGSFTSRVSPLPCDSWTLQLRINSRHRQVYSGLPLLETRPVSARLHLMSPSSPDRLSGTEAKPRSLLHLPNEILLHIFHRLETITDVYSLDQSCSRLHTIFLMDRSRILRSAARVPLKPDYGLDVAFSGIDNQPFIHVQRFIH
jgi:hypothetical protein